MVGSKLGPHCLMPTTDALTLLDAGAGIIKLVSNFGLASTLVKQYPNVTVVGRQYTSLTLNSLRSRGLTVQAAVSEWLADQQRAYQLNPLINIWEFSNEPVFDAGDKDSWLWASDVYALWLKTLRENYGKAGVIGNFPTGTPDISVWPWLSNALDAVRVYKGYLGLHEYSSPWMWWLYGKYQEQPVANPDDLGWLTLRYRRVLRTYPTLMQDIPIIIGECGLDATGHIRPWMKSGAWKTLKTWWINWTGQRDDIIDPIQLDLSNTTPEKYYAEQLIWYDRELQKDPQVVGATVFTVGTDNPVWDDWNISGTDVVKYIAEYMRGNNIMAKFNLGQTVFVISTGGVKLLDASGSQQPPPADTAGPNDQGVIQDGPRPVRPNKPLLMHWLVKFANNHVGWVEETWLGTASLPDQPSNVDRKIRVTVGAHGTPHPVYDKPSATGRVIMDKPNGGIEQTMGYFLSTEYQWADGAWWFKIEGKGLFSGDGWVEYQHGSHRDASDKHLDLLEVYNSGTLDGVVMDGKDLPDFGIAPAVWPPTGGGTTTVIIPPPVTTNLFLNPNFDQGGYAVPGYVSDLMPNSWRIIFQAKPDTPLLNPTGTHGVDGVQDQKWAEPEAVIKPVSSLTDDLKSAFIDVTWVFKPFKGSAPTWLSFGQDVALQPGTYHASFDVFPDQVISYSPKKYPTIANSADWYMGSEVGLINGVLLDARVIPYGKRTTITDTFTITTANTMTIGLTVRGRWGFANNGWIISSAKLEKTDGTVITPPPPPPVTTTRDLNVIDEAFWEIVKDQNVGRFVDHRDKFIVLTKELGAKVNLGIGLVDIIKPNRLDFSWYDPIVDTFDNRGIQFGMMMLDTLPSHMNVNGRIGKQFETEFRSAIRVIVLHFKHVNKRWVVGNEIDWPVADYVYYLDMVTDEILSADPTARVAAATPLSQAGSTDNTTPFIRNVLTQSKGKFHSWSIHPYSDHDNTLDLNRGMVELVLQIDPVRSIWITEWGHSKDDLVPHWNDDDAKLKLAQDKQRDLFNSGFDYIVSQPRIELSSYHRLSDLPWNSYGMVSKALWDGTQEFKFELFYAARDKYASLTQVPPPDVTVPVAARAMWNSLSIAQQRLLCSEG